MEYLQYTKQIETNSNINVTYYRFGQGEETIFILNAPGMSIKFWLPIINQLKHHFTIIGMEYRGYPENSRELSDKELEFDNYVNDVMTILDMELIKGVYLVSWCLGIKLALEIYRQDKARVKGLVGLNISHKTSENIESRSEFGKFVSKLQNRIKNSPDGINMAIKLMKNIGNVPEMDFFEMIRNEDEKSAALDLADMLQKESNYSNLAFYLIDTPIGLKNYIKMYISFCDHDVEPVFKSIKVPMLLLEGQKDNICSVTEEDIRGLGFDSELKVDIIDKGSHFFLIEFPVRVAEKIKEFLKYKESQEKSAGAIN